MYFIKFPNISCGTVIVRMMAVSGTTHRSFPTNKYDRLLDKSEFELLYPLCQNHINTYFGMIQQSLLTNRESVGIIFRYRGVAKFGIALGSGPRGHGFESRHSDHIECS